MKDKKPIFPKKAIISIYIPSDDIWITGKGTVDAKKNAEGKFIFEAYLTKDYSEK